MEWKTFFATFGALFLAEMGDKTQLAAISMTSKSGRPWSVFMGAVSALAIVTLIGVLAGEGLTRVVPEEYIKRGAAALFVIIGGLMWFDIL